MRATSILALGEFGWREVASDRVPRIETQQDHSGDLTEVVHKVQRELVTYRDGQTEITVGIDPPASDPVPGLDWTVGIEVFVDGHWREVEALTMSIDDNTKRWTYVPQFGAILDAPVERIGRSFKSVGGINGGTSHLARPVKPLPAPIARP